MLWGLKVRVWIVILCRIVICRFLFLVVVLWKVLMWFWLWWCCCCIGMVVRGDCGICFMGSVYECVVLCCDWFY